MVEVYKTNVQDSSEANQIVALLGQHFPNSRINFDLEDRDRILRVEGKNFKSTKVVQLVNTFGFRCWILE